MQITVRSRLTRQILLRPVQPTLTKKLLNFDVYFIFKITNQHQASSFTICRFFSGVRLGLRRKVFWQQTFLSHRRLKSHRLIKQCSSAAVPYLQPQPTKLLSCQNVDNQRATATSAFRRRFVRRRLRRFCPPCRLLAVAGSRASQRSGSVSR